MIDQKKLNKDLIGCLEHVCGCSIIPANTTKPAPPYPYGTFTILRTETVKGTYHNRSWQPMRQTWSLTFNTKDDGQGMELAMKARDYLEEGGRIELYDRNISVSSVGSIDSRDNMITIEYEFRKGFDFILMLANEITEEPPVIEKADIKKE